MKLLPEVHLVASGSLGYGITDPYDCNCYLWEYEPGQFALFDTGAGRSMNPMLEQLLQVAGKLTNINYIFLTHHHADHMGGSAVLRELTGATVCASEHSGALIEAGDENAIGLAYSRSKGGYPTDYRIRGCPVDLVLSMSARMPLGEAAYLDVVSTPGHCKGGVTYLIPTGSLGKKAAVTGDIVFPDGRIMLLNWPDCSLTEYALTIAKLKDLSIDILLPGHDQAIIGGASEAIEMAHNYFDRMLVPPSIYHVNVQRG
ncbi:hypothetical protein SY83_13495 [Paenibacillus swuensis]|uniref:Metallo-beta-lactamase domain-containing protein n=1 Tax=Paenibacillus swuensis TaxID=1178515 RepID=A0A172TJU3_9BACL|nr:MBL fold metallo-hydrolase [Paenibacillus swuensis]ANE47107.1 hypothetical protein SY83_13495 [Paenibacillus swuensis]